MFSVSSHFSPSPSPSVRLELEERCCGLVPVRYHFHPLQKVGVGHRSPTAARLKHMGKQSFKNIHAHDKNTIPTNTPKPITAAILSPKSNHILNNSIHNLNTSMANGVAATNQMNNNNNNNNNTNSVITSTTNRSNHSNNNNNNSNSSSLENSAENLNERENANPTTTPKSKEKEVVSTGGHFQSRQGSTPDKDVDDKDDKKNDKSKSKSKTTKDQMTHLVENSVHDISKPNLSRASSLLECLNNVNYDESFPLALRAHMSQKQYEESLARINAGWNIGPSAWMKICLLICALACPAGIVLFIVGLIDKEQVQVIAGVACFGLSVILSVFMRLVLMQRRYQAVRSAVERENFEVSDGLEVAPRQKSVSWKLGLHYRTLLIELPLNTGTFGLLKRSGSTVGAATFHSPSFHSPSGPHSQLQSNIPQAIPAPHSPQTPQTPRSHTNGLAPRSAERHNTPSNLIENINFNDRVQSFSDDQKQQSSKLISHPNNLLALDSSRSNSAKRRPMVSNIVAHTSSSHASSFDQPPFQLQLQGSSTPTTADTDRSFPARTARDVSINTAREVTRTAPDGGVAAAKSAAAAPTINLPGEEFLPGEIPPKKPAGSGPASPTLPAQFTFNGQILHPDREPEHAKLWQQYVAYSKRQAEEEALRLQREQAEEEARERDERERRERRRGTHAPSITIDHDTVATSVLEDHSLDVDSAH